MRATRLTTRPRGRAHRSSGGQKPGCWRRLFDPEDRPRIATACADAVARDGRRPLGEADLVRVGAGRPRSYRTSVSLAARGAPRRKAARAHARRQRRGGARARGSWSRVGPCATHPAATPRSRRSSSTATVRRPARRGARGSRRSGVDLRRARSSCLDAARALAAALDRHRERQPRAQGRNVPCGSSSINGGWSSSLKYFPMRRPKRARAGRSVFRDRHHGVQARLRSHRCHASGRRPSGRCRGPSAGPCSFIGGAAAKLFGEDPEEWLQAARTSSIGKPPRGGAGDDVVGAVDGAVAADGVERTIAHRIRRGDGRRGSARCRTTMRAVPDGATWGGGDVVGLMLDVTERKTIERALVPSGPARQGACWPSRRPRSSTRPSIVISKLHERDRRGPRRARHSGRPARAHRRSHRSTTSAARARVCSSTRTARRSGARRCTRARAGRRRRSYDLAPRADAGRGGQRRHHRRRGGRDRRHAAAPARAQARGADARGGARRARAGRRRSRPRPRRAVRHRLARAAHAPLASLLPSPAPVRDARETSARRRPRASCRSPSARRCGSIRMIEQLLDASRLFAGQPASSSSLEDVDLGALAHQVVRGGSSPSSTPSRMAVALQIPGPIVGRWDRTRLDQVITNLLSNAIKCWPRQAGRDRHRCRAARPRRACPCATTASASRPARPGLLFRPFRRLHAEHRLRWLRPGPLSSACVGDRARRTAVRPGSRAKRSRARSSPSPSCRWQA